MTDTPDVRLRRIYDTSSADDGARVLVDRLWPRGVAKDRAHLTLWDKDVAPSTELRKWYDHDPDKYEEFAKKYAAELQQGPQAQGYARLEKLAKEGTLTLLTASRAVNISEAAVLQKLLTAGDK